MTTALVIGGGIAGPTTAMALQRAGIDAVVFEAHPRTTADVGSYFTVSTNGLAALGVIDAQQIAVDVGFPTYKNVMWNARGQHLATIPLGAPLPDGTASQTFKRARLVHVLEDEAIRRGIRIEFGKRLVDAGVTRDGRVVARFDDGTEATGDLLIGADGVHSVVRRIIDPGAPSGRFVGLTNFGGYTPNVALPAEPGAWHLIFGKRAFFGYHLEPTGGAVWFANAPRAEVSPGERASTNADVWQRHLIELFAGDLGLAVDLIRGGQLELAGDNTYDLAHVQTWHKGAMIIIGDAAHAPAPSSGQGASLAMEDGVMLARCLRDRPTIPDAFATFERLRRARVERIVAAGARMSSSKTPGPVGRLLRDVMLKAVLRFMVTEQSIRWISDYRVDWEPSPAATSRPDRTPVSASSRAPR